MSGLQKAKQLAICQVYLRAICPRSVSVGRPLTKYLVQIQISQTLQHQQAFTDQYLHKNISQKYNHMI